MKNQYEGDINDYLKYSLIAALARASPDTSVLVCWMLTEDDGGRDGNLRSYLDKPGRFRAFDSTIFDGLKHLVANGLRHVEQIESAQLVAGARYFSTPLVDDRGARDAYFDAFWKMASQHRLLFFDPDNGLEVRSKPKGRKNSAKYLYWDELALALDEGRSVVIYQHFPRVKRKSYLDAQLTLIEECSTSGHNTFAVCNSKVAFLVASASNETDRLRAAAQVVARRSDGLLKLYG